MKSFQFDLILDLVLSMNTTLSTKPIAKSSENTRLSILDSLEAKLNTTYLTRWIKANINSPGKAKGFMIIAVPNLFLKLFYILITCKGLIKLIIRMRYRTYIFCKVHTSMYRYRKKRQKDWLEGLTTQLKILL